ncbi:MAG: PLP-dependent cysteine synthase family protein [Candidatus Tectomicrobia bacterium]|nr:PLP-dependent cysteine synthase family protein [Candidatus Tectomicrobia bacterium]
MLDQYPLLKLIGNTPLIPIRLFEEECPAVKVLAKAEYLNPGGSIKDRPVARMLLEAIASGELTSEKVILDSTSGNAGIAYAMIGAILEQPVLLVMPGNASEERKKRILAHGAQVRFTDPILGYDEALREVHRIYEADPDRYFLADQYKNEYNWRAHYDTTAAEVLRQTEGRLTHFVAGVGTGGTITGVGRRLKEHDPSIEVVLVTPEEWPGVEGLKPLGPGYISPEIFDEAVVDRRVTVSVDDAYEVCHRLSREGLFVGQSSGAFLAGAQVLAREIGAGTVVTVLPDLGERYFSTRLWN